MPALSTKNFVDVKAYSLDGGMELSVVWADPGLSCERVPYFFTVSVPLTGIPQTLPL